ncbi:hypothetical protein DERF_008079 [Dermatophagoides farinae]|uniref:Uncharacterized protein n=1 Tax=Dermatophagoides farinae TaxID=6954 RepID=A0A922I2M9_DERFA|nr:hypothetical protein DERF_008079 [Dermatophagoides farinae]
MYHVNNIDNNEMIMEKDEKIKKLGKMSPFFANNNLRSVKKDNYRYFFITKYRGAMSDLYLKMAIFMANRNAMKMMMTS